MIAQDIFMIAMSLMDEISSDGTFAGYDSDYKRKAWPILTVLQTELLPLSVTPTDITDENSTLLVDDRVGKTVLPYGLAAHLLLSENAQSASFFNDRYEELKRKKKSIIAPITDVYGVTYDETD
jgi:hypothetical protein